MPVADEPAGVDPHQRPTVADPQMPPPEEHRIQAPVALRNLELAAEKRRLVADHVAAERQPETIRFAYVVASTVAVDP